MFHTRFQPNPFMHSHRWGHPSMNRFHPTQSHTSNEYQNPIVAAIFAIPIMLTFWGVNFAILYTMAWSSVKVFQALGQINFAQFVILVLAFKALKAMTRCQLNVHKPCHPSLKRTNRCQGMNRCQPPSQSMTHCRPSHRMSCFRPTLRFAFQHDRQVSIRDNGETVQLSMDVPGVKASNLNVSVDNDRILTISGSRGVDNSFSRQFQLDKSVDGENLKANVTDGVLTIQATKIQGPEPIEIPITEEKEEAPSEQTTETEAEVAVETVSQEEDGTLTEEAPAVGAPIDDDREDHEEVVLVELHTEADEA